MRRLARRLAILSMAALVAACGHDEIDHGKVTGKHHDNSYMYLLPITSCFGSKPVVCTTSMIPETQPDQWFLHLKNRIGEGERNVSYDEYQRYGVGDTYP